MIFKSFLPDEEFDLCTTSEVIVPSGSTTNMDTDNNRELMSLQGQGLNTIAEEWNNQCDIELMQWATEMPSDWQVGGKCSAYLFGNGNHGQLATICVGDLCVKPTLMSSFEVAHQVECGVDWS